MNLIEGNRLNDPEWASCELVERYEQQTAYVLDSLGSINEDFKYSLITDLSRFSDFDLTDEELLLVSERLGVKLSADTTLAGVAQTMLQKNLDYSPLT